MTAPADSTQTSLANRTFERILLIKPSSLGDVVHALPVLHGLRRRYPRARIDWLISTSCAGLLHNHPAIDELVLFDRRRFGHLGTSFGATREFIRFLRSLRARHYDLAIDLQGLFRSGFLTLATGADVRLGFADARELAWLFYTHRLPAPASTVHAAERNFEVAHQLGFDDVEMSFDLAITDTERRSAAALLADAGLPDGAPFAAVLPGARWETKVWSAERFTEVADQLASAHGLPCVLMGAPDEREVCAAIRKRSRTKPFDLSGRTELRQLAAILGRAEVVVCHDSAPMHLAAAQRRPMVCILGPTNPDRTGPYDSDAIILQADLPCVPCYLRKLSQCRFNHECMRNITPAQVINATAALQGRNTADDTNTL